jgi:cyanamide hydratase family protein with HD domain
MKLTTTKPKPCKFCLIKDFIAHDITNAIDKTWRYLSNRHVQYVAKNHFKIPDSKSCTDALEFVRVCSPDHLLNHCLRSYAFGVAMAHKVAKKFDKEVLFLGSIMHDLGLTERYENDQTFEITGARVAREFCADNGIDEEKADLVHEMVALHNSVGIAHKREPEIALLHFGAGADVAGLWLHDINPRTLEEILTEYPRLDFNEGMSRLIEEQVTKKPNSYMRTMVDLGFLKKIRNPPFSEKGRLP